MEVAYESSDDTEVEEEEPKSATKGVEPESNRESAASGDEEMEIVKGSPAKGNLFSSNSDDDTEKSSDEDEDEDED